MNDNDIESFIEILNNDNISLFDIINFIIRYFRNDRNAQSRINNSLLFFILNKKFST